LAEKCWEKQGECPPPLETGCPFRIEKIPCTMKCSYAECSRPGQAMASDPFLAMSGVGKYKPMKEQCFTCQVFMDYVKKAAEKEK
jgi:hypothetical protein